MYPSFFGNYSTSFQVAANQSAVADLEKNDLQVGRGSADNTGSSIQFSNGALEHANGLAIINFIAKQGPEYYYYDGDTYNWTTKTGSASTVRAASTNTVTYYPSSEFSENKPYLKPNTHQYVAIVKPSQNTTFQSNAIRSWDLTYNVTRNKGIAQDVNIQRDGKNLGWVYSYTGAPQTFNTLEAGTYKIECWGASGGSAAYDNFNSGHSTTPVLGGAGGYCSGEIELKIVPYYIYVGHAGSSYHTETEFNGGGGAGSSTAYFCSSGGGSTDFRTTYSSDWSDFKSLKSRIMVAGGGGGAQHHVDGSAGGFAGGLNGDSGHWSWSIPPTSNEIAPTGGSQTSGGAGGITSTTTGISGGFGYGGAGLLSRSHGGGGGGGYYGGGGGNVRSGLVSSGAGGSSYISGHSGCDAISESSTESNIIHTGQAKHYSGYVFENTVMKAGNETMPSPSGGTETGHTGNGYAIITQLSY